MSNERLTCAVLIGCSLSIEGVAGVDQEGSPGNGSVKAWFEERLHSISDEGTRTSLGVQRSWRPTGYASGLPMQEIPLQHLVIESISCIQCSTANMYQTQIPL